MNVSDRIIGLLRHLGIARAHVAARTASDYQELVREHPDSIASLSVVCPPGFSVESVQEAQDRLLLVHGERGPNAGAVPRAVGSLLGAKGHKLLDYFDTDWADVAHDRTAELGQVLVEFLDRHPLPTWSGESFGRAGQVEGVSFRIEGSGPPLVLFPLGLAPHQWEPLIPALAEKYSTIVLGGPHVGIVASLEDRASARSYLAMFDRLIEETDLRPEETVLDVGCGSGALDRWLARTRPCVHPIVAVDLNRYLLSEAESLALHEGLQRAISFEEGSAEALPFPDNSFDVVVSVTVMEEVDADRMLAEMVRVTKPGGRVGVSVRAEDRPWWINAPLSVELRQRLERSSGGGAGLLGCADESLYRRFRNAGLQDITPCPSLATFDLDGPYMRNLESQVQGQLAPEERPEWAAALNTARADGTFFIARAFHCAVGRSPANTRRSRRRGGDERPARFRSPHP